MKFNDLPLDFKILLATILWFGIVIVTLQTVVLTEVKTFGAEFQHHYLTKASLTLNNMALPITAFALVRTVILHKDIHMKQGESK